MCDEKGWAGNLVPLTCEGEYEAVSASPWRDGGTHGTCLWGRELGYSSIGF